MRTRWVLALAAALLVGSVLFGGSLLRRGIMLTTADPSALGLVVSESRAPVTLTLRSAIEQLATSEAGYSDQHRFNEVQHHLSFTLSAAYLTIIDLNEGPRGSQRVGFEVWSRSLDPVTPDRQNARRTCGHDLCSEGKFAQRLAGGEDSLQVELINNLETEEFRQRSLASVAGLDRRYSTYASRPCQVSYDELRDLITLDPPPGVRHTDSCNFNSNGYTRTQDGVKIRPRHFLKQNSDGSFRYAVTCKGFSEDPSTTSLCKLRSYFGIWPMSILVRPSRIDEWDDLYERVGKFLAGKVATRTDPVIKTGDLK